jgi:hypothetical protein
VSTAERILIPEVKPANAIKQEMVDDMAPDPSSHVPHSPPADAAEPVSSSPSSPDDSAHRFCRVKPKLPDPIVQTIDKILDALVDAALTGDWEKFLHNFDPEDSITGLALLGKTLDKPVTKRALNEYCIGQIDLTYVVEPSSDSRLDPEDDTKAVKTHEAIMLGKWRPTITIDVLEDDLVQVELGRRGGRYFGDL